MIYVMGNPPQWLVSVIRELGDEVVIINDCNVPPRSIIVDMENKCNNPNTIILTTIPRGTAITINRNTARGILRNLIELVRKIEGTKSLINALQTLGFTEARITTALGISEITPNVRVEPGAIYTIITINDANEAVKCRVTLGRGSARGTLVIDSNINWLLTSAGTTYLAKGDYVLELLALSMIFNVTLDLPNTPY